MGDNTILDNVTLQLRRNGNGSAVGSVGVELWQDDGSNRPLAVGSPTAKIADIGTVENVTDLNHSKGFSDVAFTGLNLELEQNTPYWVVLNYAELEIVDGDSVSWGNVLNEENTNGAASAKIYRDGSPGWADAATALGVNAMFFSMAVLAVPERPPQCSC